MTFGLLPIYNKVYHIIKKIHFFYTNKENTFILMRFVGKILREILTLESTFSILAIHSQIYFTSNCFIFFLYSIKILFLIMPNSSRKSL